MELVIVVDDTELDLSDYCKKANTKKAEKLKITSDPRFGAYLNLIKNEDMDLAVGIFDLLNEGSKADCEAEMEETFGYLPCDGNYTKSALTEMALVSAALTDYGVGELDAMYAQGQLKHYKNIPLRSSQVRRVRKQKAYKDQSRSTQKKGKDVAHTLGLDLMTKLNMELAPRFRVDIDFLSDFLNRFDNFRMVKGETNRSLHKCVDNLLLSAPTDVLVNSEMKGRIALIAEFFQKKVNQDVMSETGGRRRLYAKVRQRVRDIDRSLWNMSYDQATFRGLYCD